MKKIYYFDRTLFLIRVVYGGCLAAIFCLYGIYNIVLNSPLKYLWTFAIFLCLYTIISNFISLSSPEKIEIDDDRIVFSAFNKSHIFFLKDLKQFNIKELHLAKKMYIRVNKASLFKGRYWIDLSAYSEHEKLEKSLLQIEETIHPNSLKVNIRRNNMIYEERKKKLYDVPEGTRGSNKSRYKA